MKDCAPPLITNGPVAGALSDLASWFGCKGENLGYTYHAELRFESFKYHTCEIAALGNYLTRYTRVDGAG